MYILVGIIIFVLSFISRVWPRLIKRDFGVDTWYFLNYAEGFRKVRTLPVKLGNYIMDIEEQWYPPLLPFIISFLTKDAAEKYHWVITAIIDSLQAVMLYAIVIFSTARFDMAVIASFLYLTTTINTSASTNLNARPFASFILTMVMLAVYNFILKQDIFNFMPVLVFGSLLLHTHKMATQQFLFIVLGLTFLTWNPVYIFIAISIFALSFFITKGHYLKILKNNVGIIRYWSKNLMHLNKHPVYASPLYYNKEKNKTKTGVSGLRSNKVMYFLTKLQLVVFISIVIFFWVRNENPFGVKNISFFFYWVFINYFTVIATSYLPFFRYFGEGFNYLIYGVFPVSFLVSYALVSLMPNRLLSYSFAAALIALNLCTQIFTLSRQLLNTHSFVDGELKEIIGILKENKEDNIMCLPVSKAEPIAYFANKKVLWGAHGSGWEHLDLIYPIIKVPVEDLIVKYNISRLLIDKRFLDFSDLKIGAYIDVIFEGSNYLLLGVKK